MFTVYVLQSESTGKIYIGQTANLTKRLERHNKELLYNPKGYTAKNKGPWKVKYQETAETREDAIKKEKYLKSHSGRNYIKSIINTRGYSSTVEQLPLKQ